MKRLALLLAAMGIVSAAAFAEAPVLKVTSVGQEIEIENSDGGADVDSIFFANSVGLSYGDWSFGVTGGKFWSYDGDDGLDSTNSRLQIDVWKKVTDDLKLGYRYRGQKNYDRHYVRWDYSNNWFWSSGDVWYESNNGTVGATDNINSEFFPVGVKFGDLKLGYFVNYKNNVGDIAAGQDESYIEHQLRAYYPLYTGEKFALNFEGRFWLASDYDYKDNTNGTTPAYRHLEAGTMRLYLKPSYKVSDSLTVYGYYGYEFKDWKYENGAERATYHAENDNYQDIGFGWTYTF
ncbi:hypothetical protein [uncultured Fusobacterium sp.]|uniref:hypothetical protein n=1 Tax=uncultured Fusobacterium sp. TaxID=159267 RepID=UPI0025E7025A|nr:hypothetical protein [uncultured Fusobacterium sp.]